METESNNYIGIYHHAVKSGLFNSAQINKKFTHIDNMVPLVRVNNFFFGTSSFADKFNYLNLAKENIVRKEYGIYYLETKKLENYLEYVFEHLDFANTFNSCPYNYFKFMENLGKPCNIPVHYQLMCKTIDNFLSFLDTLDTQQAKTIRHILTPNAKFGEFNKLEIEVSDVLSFDNLMSTEFVVKVIKTAGGPIFLRLRCETESYNSESLNTLILSMTPNNDNFTQVYNYINQQMLMKDTPEEFLICNIERVCGSRVFAEIMVKSYLDKNGFVFSLNSISSIILWASSNTESKYAEYFCDKYPNCIKIVDNFVMLNFEGINKFLLNISESDVENFEVKEQINEMYYNSMFELIHSFEQLYKNKC
jgi:hypothetical protein